MDFSAAGYRGGGVKLPSLAVAERLTPTPGDNTARIQAALDKATGAVVLSAGDYEIAGTLSITRSGVVLRGEKGASIRLTGKPHSLLDIHGNGMWREEGPRVPILDPYVPSGATAFRVRAPAGFHPGDRVLVLHPVTPEWVHFMGMDRLAPTSQSWQTAVSNDDVIRTDRIVDSVDGDRITLDVPLSDALDSHLAAASLVRYSFPGRISEVGVEGLRITTAFESVPDTGQQNVALHIDAVEDGWVRDLEIHNTQNGILIGPASKRLTLTNVHITHSHSAAVAPTDFALSGTQILLDRCQVKGESSSPVVTQLDATGPLVILNFAADHGGIAPKQGWSTGLLVDHSVFPGGTEPTPGVTFAGCSKAASPSEGLLGWAVAWNVNSPFLLVQQPPGALNWCIGCIGQMVTRGNTPNGIVDSPGKPVDPASLYLHQLQDRLGPDAPRMIGY
jgi:hypothetical protein